jgi:hypothetical protein
MRRSDAGATSLARALLTGCKQRDASRVHVAPRRDVRHPAWRTVPAVACGRRAWHRTRHPATKAARQGRGQTFLQARAALAPSAMQTFSTIRACPIVKFFKRSKNSRFSSVPPSAVHEVARSPAQRDCRVSSSVHDPSSRTRATMRGCAERRGSILSIIARVSSMIRTALFARHARIRSPKY